MCLVPSCHIRCCWSSSRSKSIRNIDSSDSGPSVGVDFIVFRIIDAAPLWADSKSFRCLALCIMYPKTPYSAAEFKFTSYKGWVKEHDAVTSQGRELYATVCYLQFLWCVQSICRVKVRASPIIVTAYLSGFTPDQFAWLCCIFNIKKLLQ